MKVLVVVDMQNDFVDGPLGSQEAIDVTQKIAEKISQTNDLLVTTYDTHGADYLDSQEGKFLPVVHCVEGSEGWQLVDAIQDAALKHSGPHKAFYKRTFGSIELAKWLAETGASGGAIDEIELVGVCTDICVISNALLLKAYMPEVKISVDASCCAGTSPESHENALKAMRQCQIVITNWSNE